MAGAATYVTLAGVSLILFSLLAGVSAFYYLKFRAIVRESRALAGGRTVGRYDEPKVMFFFVMMVSALLDIPQYAGCLVHNGPVDCEWDTVSYPLFWVFHLLSVCGYAFCITVPCVLWSDMINRKDGKLFFSKFPYDSTKRFFQGCMLVYVANTLVDLVAVAVTFRISDHNHFTEKNVVDSVCTIIEPTCILLLTCGCLWCGIKLQSHVINTKMDSKAMMRVLFVMNLTMFIICTSYLVRAILIMKFVDFFPSDYHDALGMSYFLWLLSTRWVPYVLCSFLLLASMRWSGADIAEKNLRERNLQHANLLTSIANPVHLSLSGSSMAAPLTDSSRVDSSSSSLADEDSLASYHPEPAWRPFALPSIDRDRCYSAGDIYSNMTSTQRLLSVSASPLSSGSLPQSGSPTHSMPL